MKNNYNVSAHKPNPIRVSWVEQSTHSVSRTAPHVVCVVLHRRLCWVTIHSNARVTSYSSVCVLPTAELVNMGSRVRCKKYPTLLWSTALKFSLKVQTCFTKKLQNETASLTPSSVPSSHRSNMRWTFRYCGVRNSLLVHGARKLGSLTELLWEPSSDTIATHQSSPVVPVQYERYIRSTSHDGG